MSIVPHAAASVLALASISAAAPPVLLLDGAGMTVVRERLRAGDRRLEPALSALVDDADTCLARGPWTVTAKSLVPPSGDKHDYMSVGPYWWPDPRQPDGTPYIRRDGEVNPERNTYDNVGMGRTARDSLTLALAWFYTGRETYAEHAATLLRTWFITPATRMNPNLNYGQAIPGRCEGRGIGIIDTLCLVQAVDAALILEETGVWTDGDATALRRWFGEYVDWLRSSGHGRSEDRTKNNHGTWYDVQVAAFSLYAERSELAREVLERSRSRRVATQIKADGRQPHELGRTKSWNYSIMNLKGFFELATLGDRVGVDLWRWESDDGASIRKALDWLIPVATGDREWAHNQISRLNPRSLAPLLRRAAVAYGEPRYEVLLGEVWSEAGLAEQRFQLTHPNVSGPGGR